MEQTTPADLAYKHLWLSLRNGLILLLPTAWVGILAYFALHLQNPSSEIVLSPPSLPTESGGSWVSLVGTVGAFSCATFFFGALFVGVLAALFSLLRLWPMQWLLRMCLAEPTTGLPVGLVGTLLLFESPLLIAALFGASNESIGFCALISLPFLLGALWATWRLLRASGRHQC